MVNTKVCRRGLGSCSSLPAVELRIADDDRREARQFDSTDASGKLRAPFKTAFPASPLDVNGMSQKPALRIAPEFSLTPGILSCQAGAKRGEVVDVDRKHGRVKAPRQFVLKHKRQWHADKRSTQDGLAWQKGELASTPSAQHGTARSKVSRRRLSSSFLEKNSRSAIGNSIWSSRTADSGVSLQAGSPIFAKRMQP